MRIDRLAVVLSALAVAAPGERPAEATETMSAEIEGTWAEYLFDFLPAIDACLAASSEPASVLTAGVMDQGKVGMRLVDVLDAEWDCVAEADGEAVDLLQPAGEGSEPVPPVEPVFTRAPGAPPPGGCYEHQEVEDASGEVIGWLSFHVC